MRFIFLSLSVFLFFFSFSSRAKDLTNVVLLLDWKPNTNHIGFYVAQKQGFYTEEGLKQTIVNPTQMTTTMLVGSGKENFGVSYANDIIYARNAKIPVVSIAAIAQTDESCFVWRKSSKIKGVKDFMGKRYGGWGSPEESATLKYIMQKNGADFSKLKMLSMGMSDFLTATIKNVDFTWEYKGWNILLAKLNGVPVDTYCPAEHFKVFDKPSPLLITNETMIKQHPDIIRKFVKATQLGFTFAILHPKQAAKDLETALPELDKHFIEQSTLFLSPLFQGKAEKWGLQDKEKIDRYAQWMRDVGLISTLPNINDYVNNSFL